MSGRLRVLALEPYYGGSHKAVLDCLVDHLPFEWTLLTLPARKWKWRMRGAAITMAAETRRLADEAGGEPPWDVVIASTFINLAEWRGLSGSAVAGIPAIVYFHENQLLYPNRHTAEWDMQFPLTNITSALSAERCVFNTAWNMDGFLREIPGFLREFPDHLPTGVVEAIGERSVVLPPPFDPSEFDAVRPSRSRRCRIVWPHRWEHDKDPESFFSAVAELADEGLDFEVAVAGQAFRETEEAMRSDASRLGDRLVRCGEPTSRSDYASLLASADIAVSTALNEFFGLAMIEACYAGCTPVVPDRLAYPEIYPDHFRYRDREHLVAMLRSLVLERPAPGAARELAERYTIGQLKERYATLIEETARGPGA